MTLEERIARIEKILKDNKQHELHCPAFTITGPELAFLAMAVYAKDCNCWISLANPSTDPTKGFAFYFLKTEQLGDTLYPSRAAALDDMIATYSFSRDPEAENYWGKILLIVEASTEIVEASTEKETD